MAILNIPKTNQDLVILPRKEYETLLRSRVSRIGEINMTPIQKRALLRARKNFKQGKTLSINVFSQKLERRNRR